jgi:hypothetical protein
VLWRELMAVGGGFVLEVDIRSFFDEIDHGHLRGFLDRRVGSDTRYGVRAFRYGVRAFVRGRTTTKTYLHA